jgi:hypothetical protein
MTRHLYFQLFLFSSWILASALAAPTPMDAKLTEDGMTTIECNVRDPNEIVLIHQGIQKKDSSEDEAKFKATRMDGYHYNLYLPKGYFTHKTFRYPCMFIASPGGSAGMSGFDARFKRDEWIVVMLKESRNGDYCFIHNFLAAHDDVVQRVRIASGAKFLTGMSGGSRCSSFNAALRPGIAGLICQAAAFADYKAERSLKNNQEQNWISSLDISAFPPELRVAGSFGDGDGNFFESHCLRRLLKYPHVQVRIFKGGHAWAPPAHFDLLMDWMEEDLFAGLPKQSNKPEASPVCPEESVMLQNSSKQKTFEPLGADAFLWYLRKCRGLLDETPAIPARYLMLERMLSVCKKGNLGSNKEIAVEEQAWLAEYRKLKDSTEIKVFESGARKAFTEAQAAEATYMELMSRDRRVFRDMPLSPAERTALSTAIAAYRTVADKYATAPFANLAKSTAIALDLERSKFE